MRLRRLEPTYVTYVPGELEQGRLYISMEYSTAVHLCACGCGAKAVTPLASDGWTLTFDGSVTLRPSVGNGQSPCRSHYLIWLRRSLVEGVASSRSIDCCVDALRRRRRGSAANWR
jgi:hypothetical protein